jgi:hypothetical protein
MLESAYFIQPYCCRNFEQILFGVFIMMADSYWWSIYQFYLFILYIVNYLIILTLRTYALLYYYVFQIHNNRIVYLLVL